MLNPIMSTTENPLFLPETSNICTSAVHAACCAERPAWRWQRSSLRAQAHLFPSGPDSDGAADMRVRRGRSPGGDPCARAPGPGAWLLRPELKGPGSYASRSRAGRLATGASAPRLLQEAAGG